MVSQTQLYNKYNNYNYTDDYIDIVKQYLKKGNLPNEFNVSQRKRFINQYKDFVINSKN